MKRFFVGLSIILAVIALVALVFLRTSSGFRSVYFVPSNAVLIVESKDPLMAWDKVVHSKAWVHLSSNKLLKELNAEIISVDSLVSSSKFIMKLIGKKSVMVSQHPVGNGKYEFLYIIELGKIAKYKKPDRFLSSALGEGYEITSRNYKEYNIVEILDLKRSNYYFLSFAQGKLLFSIDPKLVEAAIDASEEMIIGRERKFLDVYSKANNSGLVSLYINHNNLGPFIEKFSPSTAKKWFNNPQFLYSGINFDIDSEGLITIEGYTSITDSSAYNYKQLFQNGNLDLASASVVPSRLASLAKVNFKNASKYFYSSMQLLGEQEYESYLENIRKIEKKFKISLDENFFSWMDSEIVLLQTQPSNLGYKNEFAAILHASDSAIAAKNLQLLWRQIKKNSPVKVKTVIYKGYNIDYIAFPGLLKVLFGKALEKIEKPYFSQIGKNVIVSNHPQTIKNLIDDYLSQTTLSKSIEYYNFTKLFSNKTAMFSYFEPPVLYLNLKSFLSTESWQNLTNNKDYFTCFSQAGALVDVDDDMLHYTFKALYKPEMKEWRQKYYDAFDIVSMFYLSDTPDNIQEETNNEPIQDTVPIIVINDLDVDKQEEYFDDGSLKRTVELKKGMKHGDFKEYHPNGELKIKGSFELDEPTGKWKYYNPEGELTKTDKY